MTSLSERRREWDSLVGSIFRTKTFENQLSFTSFDNLWQVFSVLQLEDGTNAILKPVAKFFSLTTADAILLLIYQKSLYHIPLTNPRHPTTAGNKKDRKSVV